MFHAAQRPFLILPIYFRTLGSVSSFPFKYHDRAAFHPLDLNVLFWVKPARTNVRHPKKTAITHEAQIFLTQREKLRKSLEYEF